MLIPIAFILIGLFAIIALWLVIRQAKGKNEKRTK
ncbi:uncharacterized membrane protein YuzA (DUF378 family) [Mucilaginibacter sp. HD30]